MVLVLGIVAIACGTPSPTEGTVVAEAKACPGSPSGLHGTIVVLGRGQPVKRIPVAADKAYSVHLPSGKYVLTYGPWPGTAKYPARETAVSVQAGSTMPTVQVWPWCL
jgi:hypothetical protein